MLGSVSLQRIPKAAVKSSGTQSKRCVRPSVPAVDLNVSSSATRLEDSQLPKDVRPVVACISAIAAQMLSANVALADVSTEELFSLQAAQPLTELSSASPSGAGDETLAEVVEASLDSPALGEIRLETVAEAPAVSEPTGSIAVAVATSSPSLELASAAAVESIEIDSELPAASPVVVDVPAEAAMASPVIDMDIPAMPAINADTDVKTLVAALIRNEQFISALVNNEAFLDRLAGEDRVVEELARRKGLSMEVEARDELATELRRRQTMMDALAARGEAAVLAVADAARQAAADAAQAAKTETREADVSGEVGVVSSGKSALVAMETAVELLEDSQELLAAVESKQSDLGSSDKQFVKMEAAVASAERSVSKTLEKTGGEQLRDIQGAVRELYTEPQAEQDEVTINRAYTDLVTAVAEMQRAYGDAISKAVGHAVSEVVEVEEAAVKGAEKTKVLMSQKVKEVEKAVGFNPAPPRSNGAARDSYSAAGEAAKEGEERQEGAGTAGLRLAVLGAFAFWVWGTFVQPRSRYSRW